jgi:hypothetical protein
MATTTKTLTAGDLVDYNGNDLIRIVGTKIGRTTYDTVIGMGKNAFSRKTGGGVALQRTDVTKDLVTGETKIKTVTRWVEASTEVELLKRPVGLLISLPGDSWIFDGKGKQWHASGCIIEVVSVNRRKKTVEAWVRWDLRMSDEDAPRDTVGQLDSMVAKQILAKDMTLDSSGFATGLEVVSPSELRKISR